jgi:hypothetical protein
MESQRMQAIDTRINHFDHQTSPPSVTEERSPKHDVINTIVARNAHRTSPLVPLWPSPARDSHSDATQNEATRIKMLPKGLLEKSVNSHDAAVMRIATTRILLVNIPSH